MPLLAFVARLLVLFAGTLEALLANNLARISEKARSVSRPPDSWRGSSCVRLSLAEQDTTSCGPIFGLGQQWCGLVGQLSETVWLRVGGARPPSVVVVGGYRKRTASFDDDRDLFFPLDRRHLR